MEKILKQLFRLTTDNRTVYEFKPGYTTTVSKESITQQEWMQEFRVGILHGKAIVHFG